MELLEKLSNIVAHNEYQLRKANFDQTHAENLFTIEHEGTDVYDFFVDETMRDEVNPFEYYGEEKINNIIKQYYGGVQ